MDLKAQMLFAMALFLTPIAIEFTATALRGIKRYRLNDLLANVVLSLLTVVGSALIAGLTLWIYVHAHAYALFQLPATAVTTWLVGFVAYDFFYYWAHRAHHTVALLWGVHAVHHSGEDMNFGLAVRQNALGELTTWFFFLPMAIVGVPSEVYLGVAGIQLLFQYFIHNTYVPPLGWLEKVLVTPSQHRVHHGRNQLYLDKNYGNILVLWDRLFGSYQPEVREHPVVYGLRHSVRTWNPLALHAQGIVEIVRKAAACRSPLDQVLCFLKGPGWQPPSLVPERFAGPEDDGPSASFVKYDPPMPRSNAVYCVTQFVALIAFVVLVLSKLDGMNAVTAVVAVGLIVVNAWSLGGLLDGKSFFWRLELARLAAIALLVPAMAVYEGLSPVRALLPCLVFAGACALYLLRFRSGFVAGARGAQTSREAMVG